jgi:hypothetical protein
MIFLENRFPLFRIMLYTTRAAGWMARFPALRDNPSDRHLGGTDTPIRGFEL